MRGLVTLPLTSCPWENLVEFTHKPTTPCAVSKIRLPATLPAHTSNSLPTAASQMSVSHIFNTNARGKALTEFIGASQAYIRAECFSANALLSVVISYEKL